MFDQLYDPARLQLSPRNGKKKYFEGWYFKLVSADRKRAFAVIPGISLHGEEEHAFIQFIDGNSGRTEYVEFPMEEFAFNSERFAIRIGENEFSLDGIKLDLRGKKFILKGEVGFKGTVPFPVSLFSPGIMGPFRFVPFMECYHGVVSMDHGLKGSLSLEGKKTSFSGGRGYIEKDWGVSFPSAWHWVQSNHFETEGVSFMLSVAQIPWIGSHFTGFICFLYLRGKLFRFATYTGAKIVKMEKRGSVVITVIGDGKHTLEARCLLSKSGVLKAPVEGRMDRRINEGIRSTAEVILKDKKGNVLFHGKGKVAGLEIVGPIVALANGKIK